MTPLTNRLPKGGSKGNPRKSEGNLDSVYLEAAGRNDENACRFMVERKAASIPECIKDESGHPLRLYHGTAFGFTRFGGGLDGINWVTPDKGYADVYADPGRHPEPDNDGAVYELYGFPTKIADIGDINVPCDEESVARVAKAVGGDIEEVRKLSGDYPWDTWDMLYELNEYFAQIARKNGYDCFKAIEGATGGDGWGFKRKVATYGFLDPTRLKSADPITYNEDGIVSLSKRFDFGSDDIREDEERDSRLVQGLERAGVTVAKAREDLTADVEAKLREASEEFNTPLRLVALEVHGSRVRGDARDDSDLDVVFEYEGDVREDTLFTYLNEDPLLYYGLVVDLNPINTEKSGSLDEYMQWDAKYDAEKLARSGGK